MPAIRGLTVAVGEWYARTLEICLVRNMRHFTEILVVTTPDDHEVKRVAAAVPGVRIYETTDFYAHGARFNKGLCLERAFDVLGRHGWLAVLDSDILLPDSLPLERLEFGKLHGARRRILEDPSAWSPELDWSKCRVNNDGGPIGHTQIFAAEDPHLQGKPYWYDPSFAHAGGGDAAFLGHWPKAKLAMLPMDVLHLGPTDAHWFGTSPEAKDLMAKFVTLNGWRRAMAKVRPEQVERAGELVERVDVPGYGISDFELPFVKRAQAARERKA